MNLVEFYRDSSIFPDKKKKANLSVAMRIRTDTDFY